MFFMGLSEQIRAGAKLTRDVITLNDTVGSGSIQLGGTYAILAIQNDSITTTARLRLYDTSASMENATEINRTFSDTNIPAANTLVGDFSMSAGELYSIDPVLFGHTRTITSPVSYYRLEPKETPIKIHRYLLEDTSVPVNIDTAYDISNRRHLPVISGLLAPAGMVSGTLADSDVPKTYLLVSASLSSSIHLARLRLYSYSGSLYNTTEKNRSFATEPSASVRLIVDMIISGSQNVSLTPKIIGTNLKNLGTSLIDVRKSEALIRGEKELYYILENVSGSGGTVPISASLYVYALED